MHRNRKKATERNSSKATTGTVIKRRSSPIVEQGINSVPDLAKFVSALMADVDSGAIEHKQAALQNGLCGKLLGIANLRARLGILGIKGRTKTPLFLS